MNQVVQYDDSIKELEAASLMLFWLLYQVVQNDDLIEELGNIECGSGNLIGELYDILHHNLLGELETTDLHD